MGLEGPISTIRALAAGLTRPPTGPAFDQRPGELEATRGLVPEVTLAGVIGINGQLGWRLALQLKVDGKPVHVPLTFAAARELSGELETMADTIEGKVW